MIIRLRSLGLKLSEIPHVSGEQWLDGVCFLIDWVLRLLPLDSDSHTKSHLDVRIEQRGKYYAGSEQDRLARLLLLNLARVAPQKENLLSLSIQFVKKYVPNASPSHKWLAYADLIANIWNASDREAQHKGNPPPWFRFQKWLEDSKLNHRSLHSDLRPIHREILDIYCAGHILSGALWSKLMSSLQTPKDERSSVISYISDLWKEKCAAEPLQWEECIQETQKHIYNKRINNALLKQQVQWLNEVYKGSTRYLTPKEEIIFETIDLANKNHEGVLLKPADILAFQDKSQPLIDEEAHLVCLLDLHLAVQITHFFAFSSSQKIVSRWYDLSTMVIGLMLKGRVVSTLGQQEAFLHNHQNAISYFDEALALFGRLCSKKEAKEESSQTRTYKTIAMINSTSSTAEEIEEEFLLLSQDLDIRVPKNIEALTLFLAQDASGANQYMHHAFMHYLYFRKPERLLRQYLSQKEKWQIGDFHPWGWISMYRALILEEQEPQNPHSQEWVIQAFNRTPALGILMALRISFLRIATQYQWSYFDKDLDGLVPQTELSQEFHTLLGRFAQQNVGAKPFCATLRSSLDNPDGDPRDWIPKALPFNFH